MLQYSVWLFQALAMSAWSMNARMSTTQLWSGPTSGPAVLLKPDGMNWPVPVTPLAVIAEKQPRIDEPVVAVLTGSRNVPAFGYHPLALRYPWRPRPTFFMLLEHCIRRAARRAAWTAGSRRPMSTPMMLMTTSSSISVKPRRRRDRMA